MHRQKIASKLCKIGTEFGLDLKECKLDLYDRSEVIYKQVLDRFLKNPSYLRESEVMFDLPPYACIREQRKLRELRLIFPINIPEEAMEGLLAHEVSDYSLSKSLVLKPVLLLRQFLYLLPSSYFKFKLDELVGDFVDALANLKAKKYGFTHSLKKWEEYKQEMKRKDKEIIEMAILDSRKMLS